MELVAWLAGEPHTDHPACVSPVIAGFVRTWNDALPDADRTRILRPLLPALIGTATTDADERARARLATDWLIRTFTPAWLDAAHLTEDAAALRSLPEVATVADIIGAQPVLDRTRRSAAAARAAAWDAAWAAARAAAWDAARAAAWAAARAAAGAAAWDAARAAAWAAARAAAWDAAGDAAGAAAWDAARAAAWAAARAAAWDAAGDAAGVAAGDAAGDAAGVAAGAAAWDAARAAAWAAARAAAWDALAPTVRALQASAADLVLRMAAVGRS
ncbi:MAG: hypothetical protein AB7I42_22810 [Bradyrhizobium sp.]|uniref:hypothetical protein n=1 Tax=Bradyrhizobium sp. TaxID=376 RepID=UPI003D0A94DF